MKIAIVALLALAALLPLAAQASILSEQQYQFLFTQWMDQHGKSYEDTNEFFHRYNVWKSNMEFVITSNANSNKSHTLAMNHFGDLTNDEFRAMYNHYTPRMRTNTLAPIRLPETNLPTSVNWPQKGVVTPVKNQGQCGSCWAFSTTGSVESAHAIKTGNLVSLSEQELVDCSHNGNQGCSGGLMDDAFQWIIQNGGLCTESAYPYKAVDGTCKSSQCTSAVTISSYQDVAQNDEPQLQAAVAQQPVSVAVDAGGMDWQFYSGGVLSDPNCGTQLDHGVLAAGYGSQDGKDYWLVKNSWGSSWGQAGYIMLARGTTSGSPGECGIAMDPSYPIA